MEKSNNLTKTSQIISHALRHEPWKYGIELDNNGWVEIEKLVKAVEEINPGIQINQQLIQDILNTSDKKRFEIQEDKIRAFYGHSIPNKIEYPEANPPAILYHGTGSKYVEAILKEGIQAMSRQYVHLTEDLNIAKIVGKRKDGELVVLTINSFDAYTNGIKFYNPSENIWLADQIPSQFISINI